MPTELDDDDDHDYHDDSDSDSDSDSDGRDSGRNAYTGYSSSSSDSNVRRYKNYLDGGVDTEFINDDVDGELKYESDSDLHRKRRSSSSDDSDDSSSEQMFDWKFE
eukprot:CAMPEP_0202714264 /NCGR_PEP_ID=MMETSP1385-20130828/67972_1 /ASSEMBLY_ACC=CAM_ASM_000861 /TAXON_ID=933848 /ORGANISM="Elphidium margaritaceum" /LENGTH=105 /DNA_ID=CAMNT_0049374975 /DNA_START=20 /DNA_END=337 /DNA_ORIENTATION=-